jgi:hypothetical protein
MRRAARAIDGARPSVNQITGRDGVGDTSSVDVCRTCVEVSSAAAWGEVEGATLTTRRCGESGGGDRAEQRL